MSFIEGRGPFYYKLEGELLTVYLGNPEDEGPEAEFVTAISVSLLDTLVATLRKANDELLHT